MMRFSGVLVFLLLMAASVNSAPTNVSVNSEASDHVTDLMPWTSDELLALLSEAVLQEQNEQHRTKGPITAKSVFVVPERIGHCPPGTRVDPAGKCRPEFKPDPANHLGFLLARLATMYRNTPQQKVQRQKPGPLLLNIPFPSYNSREKYPSSYGTPDSNIQRENLSANNKIVDVVSRTLISPVNMEDVNTDNVNNNKSTPPRVNRTSVTANTVLSDTTNNTLNTDNVSVRNSTNVQNVSDSADNDKDLTQTEIISATVIEAEPLFRDTNISVANDVPRINQSHGAEEDVTSDTGSSVVDYIAEARTLDTATVYDNSTDIELDSEQDIENNSTVSETEATETTVIEDSVSGGYVDELPDTHGTVISTENITATIYDATNSTSDFESPQLGHNDTVPEPASTSDDQKDDKSDSDTTKADVITVDVEVDVAAAHNKSDSGVNKDYNSGGDSVIATVSTVDPVSVDVDDAVNSTDVSENADYFSGSHEDTRNGDEVEAARAFFRSIDSGIVPPPHRVGMQNPARWWQEASRNIPRFKNYPPQRHEPPEWIKFTQEVLESIKDYTHESTRPQH